MHQTLKDLLYQFIASDNPAKDSVPNRTFHAEFQPALKDDETFQDNRTCDRFLLICEKLIYKWQQVQFQYDFWNDKRALGPSDSTRDNKKSKSSQPPRAVPMATAVGEHCEGCGKPNHKRMDCTSGHDPKHPDPKEWIGCATLQDNQGMVGLQRSWG